MPDIQLSTEGIAYESIAYLNNMLPNWLAESVSKLPGLKDFSLPAVVSSHGAERMIETKTLSLFALRKMIWVILSLLYGHDAN